MATPEPNGLAARQNHQNEEQTNRTKMDKVRDWVRQPKVIVSYLAFMSVLFMGYWFEASWLVMKLVIPVGLARAFSGQAVYSGTVFRSPLN